MTANIKTATNTAPHTIPTIAIFGNPSDEGSFLPATNSKTYDYNKCPVKTIPDVLSLAIPKDM